MPDACREDTTELRGLPPAELLGPAMKALFSLAISVLVCAGSGRAAETVDYLRDVKPIFAKHCSTCHGAEKQRSGLRLDTAAAALKGGNSGPAFIPGKSADSK